MKAANSPMPRSPEASRAPLVTITAMIESCWPNCMVGPTRAVTRATDTAALRASSTLWPSVDATLAFGEERLDGGQGQHGRRHLLRHRPDGVLLAFHTAADRPHRTGRCRHRRT